MVNKEDHRVKIESNVKIGLAFFIGSIVSIGFAVFGFNFFSDNILYFVIGFILLITILGFLVMLILVYKKAIFKRIFGIEDIEVTEISSIADKVIDSLSKGNWRESVQQLAYVAKHASAIYSWYSFRRWSVFLFYSLLVGFAGLVGSALLYNQNNLIGLQNTTITKQNEIILNQTRRLDQQTYLLEADRRGSLVFLFSNVLDAIDREITNDFKDNNKRDLSDQLIARIIALSNSLKPYQFLDHDELIDKPISPERGQLLVSLIESNLDHSTYDQIFQRANFQYSDLTNVKLESRYLKYIDLKYSKFDNSIIRYCDFSDSDLRYTLFSNAAIKYSNMTDSELDNAVFVDTDLYMNYIGYRNLTPREQMSDADRIHFIVKETSSEGFGGNFEGNRNYWFCDSTSYFSQDISSINVDYNVFSSYDELKIFSETIETELDDIYNDNGIYSLSDVYKITEEGTDSKFYLLFLKGIDDEEGNTFQEKMLILDWDEQKSMLVKKDFIYLGGKYTCMINEIEKIASSSLRLKINIAFKDSSGLANTLDSSPLGGFIIMDFNVTKAAIKSVEYWVNDSLHLSKDNYFDLVNEISSNEEKYLYFLE